MNWVFRYPFIILSLASAGFAFVAVNILYCTHPEDTKIILEERNFYSSGYFYQGFLIFAIFCYLFAILGLYYILPILEYNSYNEVNPLQERIEDSKNCLFKHYTLVTIAFILTGAHLTTFLLRSR